MHEQVFGSTFLFYPKCVAAEQLPPGAPLGQVVDGELVAVNVIDRLDCLIKTQDRHLQEIVHRNCLIFYKSY